MNTKQWLGFGMRLAIFNILALAGFLAVLFTIAGLPGKPLDALAEPHPVIYTSLVISCMFLCFYAASFLVMRGRFGDLRRTATWTLLPALCWMLLSAVLVYTIIAMNLVSVN